MRNIHMFFWGTLTATVTGVIETIFEWPFFFLPSLYFTVFD